MRQAISFCGEHRFERLVSVVTQHAGVDVGRRNRRGVSVELGTTGRELYRLERKLNNKRLWTGALRERCPGGRRRRDADRTLRVREHHGHSAARALGTTLAMGR